MFNILKTALICLAFATGIIALPVDAVETVSFRHIDSRDGLPQNTVPAIVQDKQGFMWIASFDGLHRYDGYQFVSYRNDPRDPHSLSDNLINTLLVDSDNRIWVGTAQGGLDRLDHDATQFHRYLPDDPGEAIQHRRITALLQDKQKRIWIGTGQGLALYLPEKDGFRSFVHNPLDLDSAPEGAITALAETRDGKLWVGSAAGLSVFDPNTGQFQHWRAHSPAESYPIQINSFWTDKDGALWIATAQRGLFFLPSDTPAFRVYRHDPHDPGSLPQNEVRAMHRDRGGRLWVATGGGGLAVMLADGTGFESFHRNTADAHTLSIDDILSLFEDRTGLLWIGTAGGGINTTHPERTGIGRITHSPFESNTLADPFVWGVSSDLKDDLWIATLRGLERIHPATGEIQHYTQFPNDQHITLSVHIQSVHADRKGRVWFGTIEGLLAVFDPATQKTVVISHPSRLPGRFSDNRILMIDEDAQGRIWVACFEYLVQVDAHTLEIIRTFATGEEQLPSAFVRVMAERDNKLWFGTHGAGLQRYDAETRQVQTYSHRPNDPKSLSSDIIRALYFDSYGNLWIGTMNGLNRWTIDKRRANDEQFDSWFDKDGLPNSTIYGILPGESGQLWLSTNAGISKFDPKTNRFRNFDWSDGLPASEFNGLAQAKTLDGRLWFGGTTGLAVIDPSRLHVNASIDTTLITSWRVRNQDDGLFYENGIPVLASDQNDLYVSFAAPDFRDPKRNRFQWRLHGFHNEWTDIGTRNELSFTNLDAGNYELEIKHANADGMWSDTPAKLGFKVQPPWFQSGYALIVYGLLALAFGNWLWRGHRQKLREQERITDRLRRIDRLKDEFLANTSHELRTPLNGIIGVAESLRDGVAGELNEHARENLSLIADSGRRLSHLVNEILDFKKLTHSHVVLDRVAVDLQSSVNVVLALSRPLVGSKDLTLVNAVPSDFPPVDADENRLEQILHNLVGNAIKFTPQGHVTVTARIQDKTAEITISDSGGGIPEDQSERIFLPFEQVEDSITRHHGGTGLGLAVVKKLVDMHGGQITVHSQLGQGSQFTFTLPLATHVQVVRRPQEKPSAPAKLVPLKRVTLPANASAGTILVADDEPLNCQVVSDCLGMQGYSVVSVGDGQAALDAVQSQTFALLILDVMMPKLSGYDVTRRVRETMNNHELPILLLSAKNRPEDVTTGLAAGANDYIAKPVERGELVARVKTLLALHEVSAAKREREQAKLVQESVNRLSRYFPPALVKRLLTDPDPQRLQAERRRITVLFADMVEFTALTDRFEPEIITELLNQFVGGMGALVEKFGGTLNELLGDGMVVLFGAPEKMEKDEQAERSIALAVAMQREMQRLKKQWLEAGIDHNIDLRIGIHQDFATVGNFGSGNVLAYRAVGSGVNLAARLQSLCTPGHVMVSYPLYAITRDHYPFEELREVQIKGFKHPHRVCELNPEKAGEAKLYLISDKRESM